MSGYLPFHDPDNRPPDPLATLIAILMLALGILAVVWAFADAIDRTADIERVQRQKVIVDRWGEPQLVERLDKVQCE